MSLIEKYQLLINKAKELGVIALSVQDNGDVLNLTGTVQNEQQKQLLWDEYQKLDPDMRSGDLVLNLQIGGNRVTEYVVKPGDSLSKIAAHSGGGLTWKQIYEANRDQIHDPDVIHPGQKLRIPQAS